ncbi:MAG TPA: YdeI/OmpD-associated family protein [Blastocatellia bacterium]|nr:YdeI/OmpD-associated family protein [Blastocatellia bacterium]
MDSIVQQIDDDRCAQKFTPRKDRSKWSELNKKRVAKLIEQGRMTPAGLAKAGDALAGRTAKAPPVAGRKKEKLTTPQDVERALSADQKALRYFNQLAPSYRRTYVAWITSARREETRVRRLKEAPGLLAQNKKLDLK